MKLHLYEVIYIQLAVHEIHECIMAPPAVFQVVGKGVFIQMCPLLYSSLSAVNTHGNNDYEKFQKEWPSSHLCKSFCPY